jgi:hypothetical protein
LTRAFKEWLKRRWPALRLRTLLFATLLFVAALPGVGAVFLRVYENTLVQQTEAELIAQGAALAGAYRALWPEPLPPPENRLEPQRPSIDLNAMPLLPQQPEWRATERVAEEAARKAFWAARISARATPTCRKCARQWRAQRERCCAAKANTRCATRWSCSAAPPPYESITSAPSTPTAV